MPAPDEIPALVDRCDKYTASTKKEHGTAEVDAAFLGEIEQWRSDLARNLALRNPELSQCELNFAVQKTIDRIIFLRICEDRGIETYGRLQALSDGPNIYARLCELFRHADDRYNSGLFHFTAEKERTEPPDEWTLSLHVDDRVLQEIIRKLYDRESPYEFSALGADILGQVYERFLGKTIRLIEGHRTVVDDEPEVKKAGGVFYTPTYIVDYIVEQTVGKLLEGKTPSEVAARTPTGQTSKRGRPLTVLDPACGSGSFLIGAYQYLLDWYRDWYVAHDPAEHQDRVSQTRKCQWRLTTAERMRILLDHIYGVDIDPQAVEVTRLSLLLKVLEGENRETLQRQLRLFREGALPDLANNIKCGNALIGPDFYETGHLELCDEEETPGINAFDWEVEFSRIMNGGGFDAVIGNPPYIDSEWMTNHLKTTREYCVGRYQAASGNWDIFCVFVEKATSLCRPGGLTSFIVPNKLGSAGYATSVRTVLTAENRLLSVRDYSRVDVFPVSVYPIVYVAARGPVKTASTTVRLEKMRPTEGGGVEISEAHDLPYREYFGKPGQPWRRIFTAIDASKLIEKLQQFPGLRQSTEVLGAATVGEAYEIAELIEDGGQDSRPRLRLVNSGTIDRYRCLWGVKKCRYLGESYFKPTVPTHKEPDLPGKRRQQARTPKIIVAGMTKTLECILDADGVILAGKSTTIVFGEANLRLLLGILNSRLISFYYSIVFGGNKLQGGYLRVGPPQVKTIPIPDGHTQARQTESSIVEAVARMLSLNRRHVTTKTTHQRTALERQIDATDRQIDHLVYELYGLTAEEIRIVEKATPQ